MPHHAIQQVKDKEKEKQKTERGGGGESERQVHYQISSQYSHKSTKKPLTCICMPFSVSVRHHINMKVSCVLGRPAR